MTGRDDAPEPGATALIDERDALLAQSAYGRENLSTYFIPLEMRRVDKDSEAVIVRSDGKLSLILVTA